MRFILNDTSGLTLACWAGVVLLSPLAHAQVRNTEDQKAGSANGNATAGTQELQIPARAVTPLFKGEQGKQKTEIHFDPATRAVTLKFVVQDPNGYFIPGIRRENFAVYEDGIRQTNANVDIEHAPVTLAVFVENGGHYQGLNRYLVEETSRAGHQLMDEIGPADKVGVWAYADTVQQLLDFSPGRQDKLYDLFERPQTPLVSETNLYDALVFALNRTRPVNGRKAIILLSTGIDTFSKTTYDDVLDRARNGDTPIYAISLGPVLRDIASLHNMDGALRNDWDGAEKRLLAIAQASGGRLYSPHNTIDLAPTYDDVMENLRIRYVITYTLPRDVNLAGPHTVRVELVNPKTGKLLQIVDANGKPIQAVVPVEFTFTPDPASKLTER